MCSEEEERVDGTVSKRQQNEREGIVVEKSGEKERGWMESAIEKKKIGSQRYSTKAEEQIHWPFGVIQAVSQ